MLKVVGRVRGTARITRHSTHLIAVADQATSSATNLALNILVAGIAAPEVFGAVGLASALYLLETGVVRGAVADPYTVLSTESSVDQRRAAVGTATAIGLGLAGVHIAAGLLVDGPLRSVLLTFGLVTPALVLQDVVRMMLYAHRQPLLAFESNLIWAVVQAALSGVALAVGSPTGLVVAWGLGAGASAVYCLRQLGCAPWPMRWMSWFRGRSQLAVSWATDHFAQQGVAQVLVWMIGIVAGLEAVASYRGAVVLTGPVTVMIAGLARGVVLPASVRRARRDDASLEHFILLNVIPVFAVGAVLLLVPLLLLPQGVGELLLAETWEGARRILPLVIVARVLNATTLGLVLGMRATAEHRLSLRLRLVSGAVTLGGATTAAAWWGVTGGAAALALISLLFLPAWAWAFFRTMAARRSGTAPRITENEHDAEEDWPDQLA
jgi:O-antigen/teichoic acid export membrane protein